MKTKVSIGPLLVLLGALCASTTGLTQAVAPAGATPLAMGALRMLGGGISLLGFCFITKNPPKWTGWPVARLLSAAAGLLCCQLCYFAAVKSVGVAVGTVVVVGSSPIMVGFLGMIILKEQPSKAWFGATCMAIVGLALLCISGDTSNNYSIVGIGLGAVAGTSYAYFLVSVKPLLKKHNPMHIMTVVLITGGIAMIPLLISQPLSWIASIKGVLVTVNLGMVTMAAAFTLILYGMRTTQVAVTSTLGLAEPLGAALLGIFFLKEQLSTFALYGIMMLFASMVFLIFNKSPQPKVSQS